MDKLFDLAFPKQITCENINECCGELVEDDGYMICRNCFKCFPYLIDDKFVYGERQISNAYIPASYLKTKLNEFVGNVDLVVSLDLFTKCKNIHDIYDTMKANKLNSYECIYRIARELKLEYPELSLKEQSTIIFLFNQIQIKLPYAFVLSKLLEKIGRKDLVQFVYQPKNKKKLQQYETLFRKVKWF
jgi:ATP-dependent protease Clp ATPase subunit